MASASSMLSTVCILLLVFSGFSAAKGGRPCASVRVPLEGSTPSVLGHNRCTTPSQCFLRRLASDMLLMLAGSSYQCLVPALHARGKKGRRRDPGTSADAPSSLHIGFSCPSDTHADVETSAELPGIVYRTSVQHTHTPVKQLAPARRSLIGDSDLPGRSPTPGKMLGTPQSHAPEGGEVPCQHRSKVCRRRFQIPCQHRRGLMLLLPTQSVWS